MPPKPPLPAEAPDDDQSPHALTFFLTRAERRSVLAHLRKRHHDRARALLIALRLAPSSPHRSTKGPSP